MKNILIGNFVLFAASLIMVSLGLFKNKKKILLMQTIQIFMMAIGCLFLGSIPATVINLFACARNILAYHDKLNKNNKIILIVFSSVISFVFNNIGIVGLFPIISSVLFILFVDTKDICRYKGLEITSTSLWLIHDVCVLAYSAAVFDIFTIITNLIGLCQIKKRKAANA